MPLTASLHSLPAARLPPLTERRCAVKSPDWAALAARRQQRRRAAAAAARQQQAAPGSSAAAEECHYRTLEVPRGATREQIRAAYRRQARQWHPDVCAAPGAVERFKAITRAFDVLLDEHQRQRYDEARYGGSQQQRPGSGSSGGRAGGQAGGGRVPPDAPAVLRLAFREAALGVQRSIDVMVLDACLPCGGSGAQPGSAAPPCSMCKGRREIVRRGGGGAEAVLPCPICSGRGVQVTEPCSCCRGAGLARRPRRVDVRVPPGVQDGGTLRLAGEGDVARPGGPRGALLLELRVDQEAGWRRQGLDLHSPLAVPLWDALLGGTATVATLRGAARLDIPAGTAHGTVLTLPRAGVERAGGGAASRGAHHFKVHLSLPREVSGEEAELLRRLADLQRQRQRRRDSKA